MDWATGLFVVDVGVALVVFAIIRIVRIVRKDKPETPLERQVVEIWHRVVR